MTVNTITDANPCQTTEWDLIDWDTARRTVRRLQARIVKALQKGNHREVKNLRRLLILSRSARLLAVRRVTDNKGRNTPGIDGEIWKSPMQKLKATERLKQRIKSRPLRRIYIPKKNGKKRPLGIPTMLDRAHQALHLLALEPIAETKADLRSYGFRSNRSCADAIRYCFHILHRDVSPRWVLEGDIKACFDEINHQWMEENIPMDKLVLRKWLKAGFVEKGKLFPTNSGTPQGGIASPVLANMTLDGLEAMLHKHFGAPRTAGSRKNRVFFCRYADDFVITGASKELLEEKVKPLVQQFMLERGLRLSEEKTVITHIDDGFDFLGQNIRRYKDRLLCKPSKASFQSVKEKLKATVHKYWNHQDVMIKRLNAIIRGWCNFHRHVASNQSFSKMDDYIFRIIWQRAKRQHPNKGRRWIAKKYFHRIGSRSWIFGHQSKDGLKTVMIAASTKIQRYIPTRGNANPFDSDWKKYFERRWTRNCQKKSPSSIQLLHARCNRCCKLCNKTIINPLECIVHFPKDNIAVDKEISLVHAVLVHKHCHSNKT